MNSNYWRAVYIDSEDLGDKRRVMLHGELDELVGPMSQELAEDWMRRFNKPGVTEKESPAVSITVKRHRLSGKMRSAVKKKRQESVR